MGKVYGREPAMWLALLGAVWGVLSAFGLHFSDQTQSIVTAIVAAALGLAVAVQAGDGIIAAVNGLVVAAVSAVSYFALDWSAETQAQFVGAVMVVIGFITRALVTAPVPAGVSPPGTLLAKTPSA
jgi:hypothetical protein